MTPLRSQTKYRQEVYQSNLDRIRDHNNKKGATFIMGANQFADLTADEWTALVSSTRRSQHEVACNGGMRYRINHLQGCIPSQHVTSPASLTHTRTCIAAYTLLPSSQYTARGLLGEDGKPVQQQGGSDDEDSLQGSNGGVGGYFGSGWEFPVPFSGWKGLRKPSGTPMPDPSPSASSYPVAPSLGPSTSSVPAASDSPSPSSSASASASASQSSAPVPSASSSRAPYYRTSPTSTRMAYPSASSSKKPAAPTASSSRAPVKPSGGPVAPSTGPVVSASAAPTQAAGSFDWQTQGKVQAVKNQGSCGSCYAFAAAAAIESWTAINRGTLYSLSEQNVIDCASGNSGCGGGPIGGTLAYGKSGLCKETDYPYKSNKGTCAASSCVVADSKTNGYSSVAKTDAALMAAIQKTPVVVGVEADQQAWQLYKSGVVTSSCGTAIDHAVLAVGYGTDASGNAYYRIKNSWGTSWGESGYIRLGRGSAFGSSGQCGILTSGAYPI